MKKFFRYFELSLAEQRGFIALSGLVLCLLAVPTINKIVRQEEDLSYALVLLDRRGTDEKKFVNKEEDVTKGVIEKVMPIADFDPNGLSIEKWQKLGLSQNQAQVIKNYEAKGGRFFSKEDLARVYSISRSEYERLAPHVKIDQSKLTEARKGNFLAASDNRRKVEKSIPSVDRKKQMLDVMQADSADWVTLKGIGPVFAKRIINYKNALGGFNSVDQISEVYGLPPETYARIKDQLYLSSDSKIKTIDINTCSIDELSKHPYISKKQAQWIVNYRTQHGVYTDLSSLEGIALLDQDFLRKIEPYLKF
ncbi:ComEA family DNA-binding protein [Sphingobacterium faecale]|uniref:Helix-hairpin-helix domain-containing protein n=1 Tax=Sphingobacterium faecale TaxID=2803775 RepID=A0ABS1R332_9SPHI|nr:helix-hairpin-helix domain-containing protein [Sphingobacterium faecale]MBL1409112.1 helix-hairpin-helix domain-containing protein [Sphingobacterium faecale]